MEVEEFKKTILPLRDKLFRVGLRIVRSRSEAEDIVQDVMMKVWDMREEWEGVANKEAYCMTMARNLAFSRIELKENQNVGLDVNYEDRKAADSPAEVVEKEEHLRLLRKLINDLPEKQRSVMQLRDIEGMSYQEIEQILQITEEQVKVNLFRARREIKEWFLKIENYGIREN